MRPPRVAILALFFSASFFLVCRSLISIRRPVPAATSSSSQKSPFRAFFSFTAPFSLFPPSAAISLTDDNSTFFPARPAAFGPPLSAKGLSGQLWIGSGFPDEALQEGEGEGELGCSDIPGWQDGRSRLAFKAAVRGSGSSKPAPAGASKGLKTDDLGSDPVVGQDAIKPKGRQAKPKASNDGTDDHLHQVLQQTRSLYPGGPTSSTPNHADIQSMQETAEITGKVVLLSRGGCGFLEKVKWAQRRGAIALIVGDNQKGGPLIQMFARGNVDNVTIPSVFTSWTTAHLLSSLVQPDSSIEGALPGNKDPLLAMQQSAKAGTPENVRKAALAAGHGPKTPATRTPGREDAKFKNEKSAVTRRSWVSQLFGGEDSQDLSSNTNRPPSSGRLDWDAKNDKAVKDKAEKATKDGAKGSSQASEDGFQIGVQDWRDPAFAGPTAKSRKASGSRGSARESSKSSGSEAFAQNDSKAGKDTNGPQGGIVAPGSGEYVPGDVGDATNPGSGKPASTPEPRPGLLSKIFGGDEDAADEPRQKSDEAQRSSGSASTHIPPVRGSHSPREGVWVTITPTGSVSPFFDTLLVLVVSPLITLTVVYALLILRVKIRMRRWRAPKSVVDRLPVRTYHTVAPSPTQTPRTPSPTSSSPTTPLLQGSSRPRPRSRVDADAAGGGLSPDSALRTQMPPHEKNARGAPSEWKKYMGRQVECVVCLEEYVDGVSRVMSLPCGHEFHAECITPWLTTRRRTCPICKNDVVRSLARGTSAGPQYEPFREDGYESNDEESETFQDRLLSPNRLDDDDLERGPSWNQRSGQRWYASRHDVWFSALTNRLGGSSSLSTRRDGSGEDRGR